MTSMELQSRASAADVRLVGAGSCGSSDFRMSELGPSDFRMSETGPSDFRMSDVDCSDIRISDVLVTASTGG